VNDTIANVAPIARTFIPQSQVIFDGGNPATKLRGNEKASLLRVINKTRSGENLFTVELTYDKQTEAPNRNAPDDFQIPSGVSSKLHLGVVVNARKSQEGNWFLTLSDSLRQNRGVNGYTSVRLSGIRSFKVLTCDPGPLSKDRIIDII
jgi:hypothetical protein